MKSEVVIKLSPTFADERGEITNVLDRPIKHVAIITSRKGSIRGNHWHPSDEQYIYLITGMYRSVSKEVDVEHAPVEQIVEAGSLVYCPPRVAHAYEFLEDSVFLNLTLDNRDPGRYSEHTIPEKLI
jgi:dTDP-4-dehydrorhamnose 3,5-epimerase-like enzyme